MRGVTNADIFIPAESSPPQTLGAFFLWCIKGAWVWLLIAGVLAALAGVLEVMTALVLGRVIDTTTSTATADYFSAHSATLIGFVLFFAVLRPVAIGVSTAANNLLVAPNVMPLVLSRLFRWTLGQSVTFFDNDFAGRIAQKQMQTARAVTETATDFINAVTFALASVVGSVAVLVAIDPWIALALAVWLLLYLLLIRYFLPRVRKRSTQRAAARAMISGHVVDTITNIKTVKLFAHADFEDQVALGAMSDYRRKTIRFGIVSTWLRFGLNALGGILPVVLIGGALLLWTRGMATAGDIAASGAIALRISQMTGWVSMSLMSIYANVGEIEDGMNTLSRLHSLTDKPDAIELTRVSGAMTYDDVTFTYGGGSAGVRGVTLDIPAGQKVALVGASGAGKSTLVALLLRLYDTEKGRVLIDGYDVRDVTQESLRRQIAMVTQETAMFNRSARDNILYGRPDATEEEMIAAAKAAEAHEFILKMSDHQGRKGYDAHLGERGVKLSGGQRQRIALARAFLKNAPILVLDEATSALDSEVEAAIQDSLDRVMEGKTVLAIAHRLSTIAAMDRIVVLDEGRIVEEGTHDALLARDGLYARYWRRQSGGFLAVDPMDGAETEAAE
ncbi:MULTISPECIES: ABC transporter ATP-binding protein [Haematobacter]|uniref:Multidrug ABC transporter ATP-binding protein n=1 Tax=Haematobacter genomosp. 1 TaxID=366618 RepID=A0A212A9X3_9RHOB|nr:MULTISPECIES: ABC transporter ATP-binding protein [Haematobacter]OWJ76940.1 multidrug ABC transporter ATP-binding protein [Haematobacter genomosp. 1]